MTRDSVHSSLTLSGLKMEAAAAAAGLKPPPRAMRRPASRSTACSSTQPSTAAAVAATASLALCCTAAPTVRICRQGSVAARASSCQLGSKAVITHFKRRKVSSPA